VTPHAAQKIKGSAGSHDPARGFAVSQMKRTLVVEAGVAKVTVRGLTRVRHAFACNLIRMPSRLVRPISQPATRSKLFKVLSCSLPRIGDYYFIRHG
jgi:hypothetical protein